MYTGYYQPFLLLLSSLVVISQIQGQDSNIHHDDKEKRLDPGWSYNLPGTGPDNWSELFPKCSGPDKKRQSPINIDKRSTEYLDDLPDINIISGAVEDQQMTLVNNGHTAKVNVEGSVFIEGGALGVVYKIVQLHFHWGNDSKGGSEHTIDGHKYPLEMHMVSYDTERFTSLGDAVGGYNSLAVLGTLFEVDDEDNEQFDTIINHLSEVIHPSETKVHISWLDLRSLLPLTTAKYYRYAGSLTTPACAESVQWTVFEEKQRISASQLEKFRQLHEAEHNGKMVILENNFRPTQAVENRPIHSSFIQSPDDEDDGGSDAEPDNGGINTAPHLNISFTLVTSLVGLTIARHIKL
jgi:carbonic anhydrase